MAERLHLGDDSRGLVQVLYGSDQGFSARASQMWSHADFGAPADEADIFGQAMATGDFDGDDFSDLAVGDPRPDSSGAGVVRVLYGSADGLSLARAQLWNRHSSGLNGKAKRGDRFGWSLAVGNLGRGSEDDLVIGVQGEAGRGVVQVIFGGERGLTGAGNQTWGPLGGPIGRDAREVGFGSALAVGDFDGQGYAELAVGVPGARVGHVSYAGAVNVIRGSAHGLTAEGNQWWNPNSDGVDGTAEEEDGFGSTLKVGCFTGRRFSDLAIGAPYKAVGGKGEAGAVTVIYGSSRGLTSRGSQLWTEVRLGSQPARSDPESEDAPEFGSALTAANFGHNVAGRAFDDLAIGVPGAVKPDMFSGAVQILYGSTAGLTAAHTQQISQESRGIRDSPHGGAFGAAVAAGAFGRDSGAESYADLAIGAPLEIDSSDEDFNGAVYVLRGSANGPTAMGYQLWTAASLPQLPTGDFFGGRLAS